MKILISAIITKLRILQKRNLILRNISLFFSSLQFHKHDLNILLDSLNFEFDIIAISETKISKNMAPTTDISFEEYNTEDTPTEAEKGGTLLYISKKHIHKPRKDLEIYQSKEIESTFAEILVPNGKT